MKECCKGIQNTREYYIRDKWPWSPTQNSHNAETNLFCYSSSTMEAEQRINIPSDNKTFDWKDWYQFQVGFCHFVCVCVCVRSSDRRRYNCTWPIPEIGIMFCNLYVFVFLWWRCPYMRLQIHTMPDKLETTWKQPTVTQFRNLTGICLQLLRKNIRSQSQLSIPRPRFEWVSVDTPF
jgi:hypothetical protein